ncbi:MAG: DUF2231 domain-containing protein [Vicinamibacterales bacterium]
MPTLDLAPLHPIVVHFVIALSVVGVLFRWVSLVGRPAFAGPAAATLILLATAAGMVAAESGELAHGPAERVPGARHAVEEHEEWGERAKNALLILAAFELAGLALYRWSKVRTVRMAAAVVGLGAIFCVYEAGEHGGELVYSYAGGVGVRTGDPKDVERLLMAGYYHQAMADRKAGRHAEAAALIGEAAKRFAADPHVQLLAAESLLVDQKSVQPAIEALAAVKVPDDSRPLRRLKANLLADGHLAAGEPNQAVAVLEDANKAFPDPRFQQRIDQIKAGAAKP